MLSSATFRTIAAALRSSADMVDRLAVNNDTNPQASNYALARIMKALADTATTTAEGILIALTLQEVVGAPPARVLKDGNVCICGQCPEDGRDAATPAPESN